MAKLEFKMPSSGGSGPDANAAMRNAMLAFTGAGEDFRTRAESLKKDRLEAATNLGLSQIAGGGKDGLYNKEDLANLPEGADMSKILTQFDAGRNQDSLEVGRGIQNRLGTAQAQEAEHKVSVPYLEGLAEDRRVTRAKEDAQMKASLSSAQYTDWLHKQAEAQVSGLEEFGTALSTAKDESNTKVRNSYEAARAMLEQQAADNNTSVDPAELQILTEALFESQINESNKAILRTTQDFMASRPVIDITETGAYKTYAELLASGEKVRQDLQKEKLSQAADAEKALTNAKYPTAVVTFDANGGKTILENQQAIDANSVNWENSNEVQSFAQSFGLDPEQSAASVTAWGIAGQNNNRDPRTNEEGIRDILRAAGGSKSIASRVISDLLAKDWELFSGLGDKEEKYIKDWEAGIAAATEMRGEADGWAQTQLKVSAPKAPLSIFDLETGLGARRRDATDAINRTPTPPPPPPGVSPAQAASAFTDSYSSR